MDKQLRPANSCWMVTLPLPLLSPTLHFHRLWVERQQLGVQRSQAPYRKHYISCNDCQGGRPLYKHQKTADRPGCRSCRLRSGQRDLPELSEKYIGRYS